MQVFSTAGAAAVSPPASRDLRAERPDRTAPLHERLVHDAMGLLLFASPQQRALASIVPQVEALAPRICRPLRPGTAADNR